MSENNNTETTKKTTPDRIVVEEHERFEALAATTMTTTQKLAKRINALFSTTFVDYYGAAIYMNSGNGNVANNQQFTVEIHFKPIDAGMVNANDSRIRAFRPINENVEKSNIVANLKSIYGNMNQPAKFEITEQAAELLSEFILPGADIKWDKPETFNRIKAEYVDNVQFGQAPVMVKIFHLDLVKLIKKIYGSRNDEGKRIDYGVIPYGPVMPNMNNTMIQNNANWRVIVMQIEAEKTFDLATEFGLIPAAAGANGPIVTGY